MTALLKYRTTIKEKGRTSMKLLLDEMHTGLKEYLQTLGLDVLTVHDAKLVGASGKNRRIRQEAQTAAGNPRRKTR